MTAAIPAIQSFRRIAPPWLNERVQSFTARHLESMVLRTGVKVLAKHATVGNNANRGPN